MEWLDNDSTVHPRPKHRRRMRLTKRGRLTLMAAWFVCAGLIGWFAPVHWW